MPLSTLYLSPKLFLSIAQKYQKLIIMSEGMSETSQVFLKIGYKDI